MKNKKHYPFRNTMVIISSVLSVCLSTNVMATVKEYGYFYSLNSSIKISADKYREFHFESTKDEEAVNFHVYCENKNTSVVFYFEEHPLKFLLNEKDTICFSVLFGKEKDTCRLRVIGVKNISNTLSQDEKVYYLSKFWSEAKYNFVNMPFVKFNWDSLYRSYIPKVMNSSNDYDYAKIMSSFAASLKDGHTQILISSQFYTYTDYIPVSLKEFDKRIYITGIRKGIGLDSSFLGGEIISVSGVPIHHYLRDSIFPYISASTDHHLRMQAVFKLQNGLRMHDFKAEIKKTDGKQLAVTIRRNGEFTRNDTIDKYYELLNRSSSRKENVELFWLEDSIAHLIIRRFFPEEAILNKLYSLQQPISKAKGLIIDIRENGGGSTRVAQVLQSYLTPAKQKWILNFGWSTRVNDGVKKANGNWIEEYADYYQEKALRVEEPDTVYISDTMVRFTMPKVVIFGQYTFSAAEDFLVNLYEVPNRPLFIGEPSGGSTGSPLVITDMPFEGYARICTRQIQYPYSRKPFVNEGVKPDILIIESFDDYLQERDVVLERAVQYVKEGE